MIRAVFLDRDGVINEAVIRDGKPYPPTTLEEFRILPGVHQALSELHDAGFLLIVATNQPDIARGLQERKVVEAMHERLKRELPIDDIKMCDEVEHPSSTRYKPRPGMLLEAASERAIDLSHSYMVGDRWRDIGCGKAAGCFTVFIDHGYTEPLREPPDATCADLLTAATIILCHAGSRSSRRRN